MLLQTTETPGSRPTRQGRHSQHLRRFRAVVVDDSPAFLEASCSVIELTYEIDVIAKAGDGIAAIQAVADLRPDLVVMDINMPGLNGLTAASIISERFPNTGIVLMSAEDSRELREACKACGAEAFVYKVQFGKELQSALASIGSRRAKPEPYATFYKEFTPKPEI